MVSEEREDVKWEARRCFLGQRRCVGCVAHKQKGLLAKVVVFSVDLHIREVRAQFFRATKS